jgi:two-component system response regulator
MSTTIPRILLVEDSPRDAELTRLALQHYNLANEILHLCDGAEALDYLYRRGAFAERSDDQPPIVLLDLKMPKVDGLEVLHQIKSDPELRSIPIVVMTSSWDEQDLVESYSAGVNAYIAKPINFKEFVDAVKQIGGFWAVLNKSPFTSRDMPPSDR